MFIHEIYRAAETLTNVVFTVHIMFIHEVKQPDLYLCLVQERFLVLDDLDGDILLLLMVVGLGNL